MSDFIRPCTFLFCILERTFTRQYFHIFHLTNKTTKITHISEECKTVQRHRYVFLMAELTTHQKRTNTPIFPLRHVKLNQMKKSYAKFNFKNPIATFEN